MANRIGPAVFQIWMGPSGYEKWDLEVHVGPMAGGVTNNQNGER